MAWRTVMIQNPAKLNLSKGQLRVENNQGEVATLPIEDITTLILESPQIQLSSTLLSACQQHGVALITCDEAHMPNGVLLPFQPHSRQSRVAALQQSWSEPLRKRLWQKVVQGKITNQAMCLARNQKHEAAERLAVMSKRVQSGDPDNMEAQAARLYWRALMGADFRRGASDKINAALNYGYAVVRASVARSQVAYGLLPVFGIHHSNDLNAFNLTDDMMEVLRPFVDDRVWQMVQTAELDPNASDLSISIRQKLAAIMNTQCLIGREIHSLSNACDTLASTLVSAIEGKSAAILELPSMKSLQESVS
jgi:CRISP-associated protein Cas1